MELYRRVEGTGEPVVLVHGLGGDHTVWNAVIDELSGDLQIVAPDLRGHGRSPAPADSTFSFAELSADLVHLLDELHLERVNLVGLSAGAFLALQFALETPNRLRSLVVIGAATHCDNHTRGIAERWLSTYQKEGFDAYVLRLLKDLYYPDWIEAHLDVADQLRAQQRRESGRGVLEWGKAIRGYDLRGRLGRITIPTLVIQAVDDQVVDPAHGRLLRQSIRGAELRLLAQTGHLVPVERPHETAEAIRAWVAHPGATAPSGG